MVIEQQTINIISLNYNHLTKRNKSSVFRNLSHQNDFSYKKNFFTDIKSSQNK